MGGSSWVSGAHSSPDSRRFHGKNPGGVAISARLHESFRKNTGANRKVQRDDALPARRPLANIYAAGTERGPIAAFSAR
jgi:hypothetical protein